MKNHLGTAALFCLFNLLVSALAADELHPTQGDAKKLPSGHLKIPLQVKKDLKAVYQISDDALKGEQSRALVYARKLLDTYNANGVPDTEVELHLVFHSHGTNALVNSETRQRLEAKGSAENPNQELVAELVARGVHIELCQSSMDQRNVTAEHLIAGVNIVVGAFPRIIELQHLGCAYIKFE